MSEQLLAKLAPRLRKLDEGAYERVYRVKKGFMATGTHQLVADYMVNGVMVFAERKFRDEERRTLSKLGRKMVMIEREPLRRDGFDHGLRVLGLGEEGRFQTIFLDDPSFNFDYAHILPKTEKCSVMHGHTSSVLVELVGRPVDGMVVDFGIAKQAVREAVRSLDHMLFILE